MSNRSLILEKAPKTARLSARSRVVATLSQEILSNPETKAFPIESESQLCQRFKISRVTVRLALGDLENRGLIYRKHGKGTYAHGHSTRAHRNITIFSKSLQIAECRPIAEMIRGAQAAMYALRSATVLISTSPDQWRPQMANAIGGVIVIPQNVTMEDIDNLRNRNLPFLIVGDSCLPGPRILLGQEEAAKRMTERLLDLGHRQFALLSGFDNSMDTSKREGIQKALRVAGIDPTQVPELSPNKVRNSISSIVHDLLRLRPRPTAVIAFDDSLGLILSLNAQRQKGIHVPSELSIVSLQDCPHLNQIEPVLTTLQLDYFVAGQRAAEFLIRASLTGNCLVDFPFLPTYQPGHTLGPPPYRV